MVTAEIGPLFLNYLCGLWFLLHSPEKRSLTPRCPSKIVVLFYKASNWNLVDRDLSSSGLAPGEPLAMWPSHLKIRAWKDIG